MILWMLACAHVGPVEPERPAEVRLRPEEMPGLAANLHLDAGLRAAAEELVSDSTREDARLVPSAVRLALGRAGYPRDAHFLHARSADTAIPRSLLDAIPASVPVELGWASRPARDGGYIWVVGWAPTAGTIDPLPRDVTLDRGLPLRVDGIADARLFVGSPDGRAQELSITSGQTRWVDVFHVPGEYRLEVVDGDRVAFLFSVYADASVGPALPLPGAAPSVAPVQQAAELAARVNALRAETGLRALTNFQLFEPITRAQAACLASVGEVGHKSARCPGVPAMAEHDFHPRAKHHEDVVAADTAEEAWERLYDSPGHRMNLLCAACTHMVVGAAAEATVPARVFAVLEVMEFPEGAPAPIVRGRR